MDLASLGLIIIGSGLIGAMIVQIINDKHNNDVDLSESILNDARLEQLINISGGGSLAQILRLYKIRGNELEKARRVENSNSNIRSLVHDRILLSQEISRLIVIDTENISSLFPINL
jgi:predicted dinucleotide-utilizing enzyme